ncbi:MAG: hypothetical protein WCT26_03910 [Candidatus Buchananbacteria bacterium]|jgi:rod shape-determining protein MreD
MPKKNLYYILLACALIFLQLAVVGNLNFFGGRVNLTLVVLIILINLAEFNWVVTFTVVIGLLLDVYSGLPFGILTLSLFISGVTLKILFLNFFTNFSFYSLLLLGLIAVILYNAVFIFIIGLIYFIGLSDYLPGFDYLYKFLWQILTTELIMVAAYYFINSLSRKFKPVFIG